MKILIAGGTGTTGGYAARLLSQTGHDVTLLARRPPAADSVLADLPYRQADMRDGAAMGAALHGVDAFYFVTPFIKEETEIGLGVLDAAERAGVPKIAYLSIMHLEAMQRIPHFANKIPIKQRLLGMDATHVILEPNIFFQNDLLAREAIVDGGVYPFPIGDNHGLSAIDARDIGAAVARALSGDALDNGVFPLAGPEALTGPERAAIWAEALGRPVAYGGNDTAPFIAQIRQVFGDEPWLLEDLRIMMEENQRLGNAATAAELAASQRAIGHPPRRYRDFVQKWAAIPG